MPIGIFDSGVGGLTAMKEIIRELPDENILYLGDTARVPYGARSPETVSIYSLQNAQFLMSKGIKLLVVACNTASSVSLELLMEKSPVPVVGVIEPGAKAAVARTELKRIAVIGTETTLNSKAYERVIKSIDSSIKVFGIACPLFVPLVEEGWLEGEVVTLTAEKYLSTLKNSNIDALVLGCTHYPMIKGIIADIIKVPLVDSAVETAKEVKRILRNNDMLCKRKASRRLSSNPPLEKGGRGDFRNKDKPLREFFVTDSPERFARAGRRFLGYEISNISKIDLDIL